MASARQACNYLSVKFVIFNVAARGWLPAKPLILFIRAKNILIKKINVWKMIIQLL